MSGTSVAATRAIRLMPPTMTSPSSTASTPPESHVGISNEVSSPDAMLFACGRLPEPNELITVAIAKTTASHFRLSPCSM